jgi:hypothetical protein
MRCEEIAATNFYQALLIQREANQDDNRQQKELHKISADLNGWPRVASARSGKQCPDDF